MSRPTDILSRRRFLGAMFGASGALALAPASASTPNLLSQQEVQFQYTPNGSQRCSNCSLFRPPNVCSAVAGSVASEGWCTIWRKKDT